MAPLNFSISLITFLLYCLSLSSSLFLYFPDKTEATGSHFHNVDVISLFAASDCNRHASTGSNTEYSTTLEVVDKHGPCSPLTNNKPSLADILSRHQSRVDSIQSLLKLNQYKDNKASLPAQSGVPLCTDNYVVTVGLGTPLQNVTLIFDTAASITWTQCKPCIAYCYPQQGPVYNPYSSRTYSTISCNSFLCSKLDNYLDCYTGPCICDVEYGDDSYSVGMWSKERLTITPNTNDVIPHFIFGCGQKNRGWYGETAGVLGLGKPHYVGSFLNQTAAKYKLQFSYCLPSNASSTGYLTFGRNKSNAKNMKFTPLILNTGFYFIEMVAISVGGTKLAINQSVFQNSGTYVDSSTVISCLPMEAYAKMRYAFNHMIGNLYPNAPAFSVMDTCYTITNHANIKVPRVSFTFSGGAEVELNPSGIMIVVNSTLACLAFSGNADPNHFAIFGSTQQRTVEMVYDVAGEKLGFRQGGCK